MELSWKMEYASLANTIALFVLGRVTAWLVLLGLRCISTKKRVT